MDPISSNVTEGINFLAELYDDGLSYSSISTARSALSTLMQLQDGENFGSNTLRVQKYGNDGLKHGGKDVLWPMSLVTKGRFSLQPRPQFKHLWRESIRHLVFCLSNRQGQVLEKLFMNFETRTWK